MSKHIEIERRFLLKSFPVALEDKNPMPIMQGYLSTDPQRTVRVRLIGNEAKITIKGLKVGASAPEFEYAIPYKDGIKIIDTLCTPADVLKKDRYLYRTFEGRNWEIDRFKGNLTGLFTAEVELPTEKETFLIPKIITDVGVVEITTDHRFANANITNLKPEELKALIQSVFEPTPG